MRFLERFFGRQDKKAAETRRIKFSELEDWLLKRKERENQEIYRRAEPLIGHILESFDRVSGYADRLERAECPREIPKRARKIVLVSKPEFVRGIRDSLKGIENSGRENIDEFHHELDGAILGIGKVIGGQGRYLPIAFGDIIQEMARELKSIVANGKELKEFIPKGHIYDSLLGGIKDLGEEYERLEDLAARKKEARQELRKAKADMKKLVMRMKDLENSPEIMVFHSLESMQEQLDEKKRDIESRIYSHLSPIKRPLKKFKKVLDRKDINAYIENPLQEFLSNGSGLGSIVRDVRKAIDSGNLEIKKSELDKIANVERNLEELMRLGKSHSSIESELADISKKLLSSQELEKRKGLAREIEHIGKRIDELEREPGKIEKKMAQVNGRISDLGDSIRNSLLELEPGMRIGWDD